MAAISHEHVVPVYTVDEHRGLPYFAMEYVPGGTLESRIRKQGPLDALSVLRISRQIALALSAAHECGLLRQLKSVEGVEREGFFAELKSYVGAQFDQRQEGKARELKALEEQLAKLKEIHNKRTQQRDKIVADRVQQIIREVDGLGWGTDSADFPKLRSTFSADRMFMAPADPGVLPDFGGGLTGATIPPPQPASALPRRS